MSMTAARSYFRSRATSLNLKEWKDPFEEENIPANIIDRIYMIESGLQQGMGLNQQDQMIAFPVTIKIFLKAYRDVSAGIDSITALTENYISECLDPTVRLTQTTGIKNIVYEGSTQRAFGPSNDNLIVSEINFRALIALKVD